MPDLVEIPIRGTTIDLDQFLKLSGTVASGGEAKYFINEGLVHVNNEPEQRRRRKLTIGDVVSVVDVGDFSVASDDA